MVGPDFSVRPGLAELTHRLKEAGKHITIETAGLLFVPDLACDLMSISPKLTNAGSHRDDAQDRSAVTSDPEAIRRLIQTYPYQLKFVVESPQDAVGIQQALTEWRIAPSERVMLMPEATTVEELISRSGIIAAMCKETHLRFGERLHILLWSGRRGT